MEKKQSGVVENKYSFTADNDDRASLLCIVLQKASIPILRNRTLLSSSINTQGS